MEFVVWAVYMTGELLSRVKVATGGPSGPVIATVPYTATLVPLDWNVFISDLL